MRAYTVFAFALPVLAAATDIVARGDCDTGNQLCCNQTQQGNTTSILQLASTLGIALPDIGALVGLSCSPISVLGIGGNSCSQQPVCCNNNNFGGLIAFGCNPLNLNL